MSIRIKRRSIKTLMRLDLDKRCEVRPNVKLVGVVMAGRCGWEVRENGGVVATFRPDQLKKAQRFMQGLLSSAAEIVRFRDLAPDLEPGTAA